MQSDGGLCSWDAFSGLRAILSGPAGGVVGYSKTCYDEELGSPLIAVDMGGTSTDVSRFAGKLEHVFETTTAEVIIQAPQLDINTVAAGGGSRLFYRHGMFVVGPEVSQVSTWSISVLTISVSHSPPRPRVLSQRWSIGGD